MKISTAEMKSLYLLEYPPFYGLSYARYREQHLHLIRLALHAEKDGMSFLGERVEHLLHKERIHL